MALDEPDFDLSTSAANGEVTVRVQGELDVATAPRLERALEEMRAEHASALVDLSALRFIDSSGLRALLEQRERWGDDGKGLRLARPGEQVRRVFAISGLDDVFDWAE